MKTKVFEIRDEGTRIAALAIKMESANEIEDKFLWHCGYPRDGRGVVLMHLGTQKATSDAYAWGGRTMPPVHLHIERHWDELSNGDVIDTRVLLGESEVAATPEIWKGIP
jgi:hypothetical protein